MKYFKTLLIIFSFQAFICCRRENIDNILIDFQDSKKIYSISNKRDTVLNLKSGIKINIPKKSFDSEPDLTLEIVDLGELSDIIKYGISTVSNGQILKTRGMINITASCNGKNVKLAKDKSIELYFPKLKNDTSNMYLFKGEVLKSGLINWVLSDSSFLSNTAYITKWEVVPCCMGPRYENLSRIDDILVDSLISVFHSRFEIDKTTLNQENVENTYQATYDFYNSSIDYDYSLKRVTGYSYYEYIYDTLPVDQYLYNYLMSFPATKPFKSDLRYYIVNVFFRIGQVPDGYNDLFIKQRSIRDWQTKLPNEFEDSMLVQDTLDYFVMNSSSLGWINCDYFLNIKDSLMDIEIPINPDFTYRSVLVFKNYKSVIWGLQTKKSIKFNQIPSNEPISLLTIRDHSNNIELSRVNGKLSSIDLNNLKFKRITLEELESEINRIE